MKLLLRRWFPLLFLLILASCSHKADNTDYSVGINDIPGLNGFNISVLSGSLQELTADSLCPQSNMLCFNSAAEVITSVATGQADFCILDSSAIIGAHIEQRGLKVSFSANVGGDEGFAFNLKDTALQQEFNDFLARFRADGRWDSIYNLWTKGNVENVVMQHPKLNPDGPTLRVGTNAFFPFSFIQNGHYSGYEMEIIEAFCAETGRNVEYFTIDFTGLIAALVSNKIDLASNAMFITPERAQQVLFSDPYFNCTTAALARSFQPVAKKSFATTIKDAFYNNLIADNRWMILVEGLWETVIISVLAILFGTLFGAFICWMSMSRRKVLGNIAHVYIEIIRGVPILVLLMLMFYVIFAQSTISPRWVAVIAFAMNFGAFVSEIFRTGIESVDRGQTEAGLAMGFSNFQTFLFFIIPQSAKRIIPLFKGEAVSLFKNTSVVGFIAIQDLTKASEIIRARTFDAFFPIIVISIIYFILAWLFGKLLDCLAKNIA